MVDETELLSVAVGRRVVITITLLTAVSVLATYAVPRGGATLSRWLDTLLDRWGIREPAMEFWEHTPPGVSFQVLVYVVQGALFVLMALFLLGLWGWASLLHAAIHLLFESLPSLPPIGLTALVLAVMYSGSRYIGDEMGGLSEKNEHITEHSKEILTRSLQLVLLLGGTLTIFSIWKVDIDSFLLGAGVLSVLLGLAARSTLSSVIAGFVLMFSRPFEVGDWVEISDTEGQVTDVTIVNTRLRTPEGERVILPNDTIGEEKIVNYSHESKLCIPFEVGVAYGTNLDHATEVIKEALADVELFSSGSAVEVYPRSFGDSDIVLEVRFWVDHPHPITRRRARARAVEHIKDAFREEGIEIPFPQREIQQRQSEQSESEVFAE